MIFVPQSLLRLLPSKYGIQLQVLTQKYIKTPVITFEANKAKGKYLTFSKFIDLLIKISYLYARDSTETPNQMEMPSEIFIMLLEKLELSGGFLNLEKKTNKPHTSRTSLLPSREIVSLINNAKEGNIEEVVEYIQDKNSRMMHRSEQQTHTQLTKVVNHNTPQVMKVNSMDKQSQYFEGETQELHHLNQMQDSEDVNDIQEIANENIQEEEMIEESSQQLTEALFEVFELYSSLGYQNARTNSSVQKDDEQEKLLCASNFLKMITSINPQEEPETVLISTEDISMIFEKARYFRTQYGNESLNFMQFQFALKLVAMKVFGYTPDGFLMLVQDYILPLQNMVEEEVENNTEHILQLMDILKDEEMVQLLELMYQTVYPYFKEYSNEQGLMPLIKFEQLCRDFKIFPDILPQELVLDFFKTLSNFYCTNREDRGGEDMIDEHLFVEVLALSALEMKFEDPQPSQVEKVIVLLD